MNKTTVMAKGTLNKLLCFILMTGLFSCGDTKSTNNMSKEDKQVVTEKIKQEQFATYKILKTESSERSRKAQVICRAYLTTDTVSEAKLSGILNQIYSSLEGYSNFKNFSSPTVIAIYLFTSIDKATNMPEAWIAMLSKTPSDNLPRISFNDLQLKAKEGAIDNIKSAEEKKQEELADYFKKRNTDICFIYKTLYDLEGTTIKQADIKYPDFGINHSEYQSKLYKQGKRALFEKYNIDDTLSVYITIAGMSYCK